MHGPRNKITWFGGGEWWLPSNHVKVQNMFYIGIFLKTEGGLS
jgi:hypothetical protein